MSSGDPPWRLTAIGFQRKLQQAAVYAAATLVDGDRRPGGGGLLIFEASSYADALAWVQNDPMIRDGLVDWQVQEWIPVSGDGWP